MSDSAPEVGGWKEHTTAFDRVWSVAVSISERRTAAEIAAAVVDKLRTIAEVGVPIGESLSAGKRATLLISATGSDGGDYREFKDSMEALEGNTRALEEADSDQRRQELLEKRLNLLERAYGATSEYQSNTRAAAREAENDAFTGIIEWLYQGDEDTYLSLKGEFDQTKNWLSADYHATQVALERSGIRGLDSVVGYEPPEYPDPAVKVSAPEKATVGETVTVKITVSNNGGNANSQTAALSFPDATASDVSIAGTTHPNLNYKDVYGAGRELGHKYGAQGTVTADYPLAEAAGPLGSGESFTMTVEVTPRKSGEFRIYAKSLGKNGGWYAYPEVKAPGGTTDQQSEYVVVETISVVDDSDDDGLTDAKENQLGTDPNDADTDGDGLGDAAEANGSTDPTNADTDGDGLDDKREVNGATDPTVADTDGDGLDDGREVERGTDPTTVDTDGDGLDDKREVELGTNPTTVDTDGDGLDDKREINGATDPTVADTDGDGLDDGREVERGTDPTTVDSDDDGLNDKREVELGTDPTTVDSDDDGLDDKREVELGTDPTTVDSDDDGLDDKREANGATDPTVADTDDDGLDDGREIDVGTDPLTTDTDDDDLDDTTEVNGKTDPLIADTDGDGFSDGVEIGAGTDPTDAADHPTNDSDKDGLSDSAENANGTDPTVPDTDGDGLDDGPEVNEYGTDPTVADTDGDGYDDGTEIQAGTDPTDLDDAPTNDPDGDGLTDSRENELGTDPTVADTDGDGLDDGTEVELGTDPLVRDTDGDGLDDAPEVNEYGTDPTVADTDGDGYSDSEEVEEGTDPTDAEDPGSSNGSGDANETRDSANFSVQATVDAQTVDTGSTIELTPLIQEAQNSSVDISWLVISKPATSGLDLGQGDSPAVYLPVEGTYVFRVDASSGGETVSDRVTVQASGKANGSLVESSRTIDDGPVGPGDSTTVSSVVRLTTSTSRLAIIERVPTGFEATNLSIEVDGQGSVLLHSISGGAIDVVVQGADRGTRVTMTYTVVVPETAPDGSEHRFSGTVTTAAGDASLTNTMLPVQTSGLDSYAGSDDRIDSGELRTIISDWAFGDIDTTLLQEAIQAWVLQREV